MAIAAAQEILRRRRVRDDSKTLMGFMRSFWHVLEPSTQFKTGWALDAMAEHLEAVSRREIKRLIINVPPGMSKSLMTSVFWPAWEWTFNPSNRVIATAYAGHLSERDSRKFGTLVKDPSFTSVFGDTFLTTKATITDVENDRMGSRKAMAFGSLTGSRGNVVIIDDPLSVDMAKSPRELQNTIDTFTEAVPSRLNDPERDVIVMIMQRLHERDPSGIAISHNLGYEHLMLPMEFETDRRCHTSIGFSDPRTYEGELLFPERFSREVVDRDKRTMTSVNGSYAVAGQYQQRPVPRGGGMFKREWFKVLPVCPPLKKSVRAWDLAATQDPSAARTAGVLMGEDLEGRFIVADVRKGQLSPSGVEAMILQTAALDGNKVKGSLPRDPGQAGKAQAEYLVKQLKGYPYTSSPETGAKDVRAQPFAAQAEVGNVYVVAGEWVAEYLDELEMFPAGQFMDQVDASSRAFNELTKAKTSMLDAL